MSFLIDAHCHLYSPDFPIAVAHEIQEATKYNIRAFISCALTEQEYNLHIQHPNPEVIITAGQHPLFKENAISCETLEQGLKRNHIHALGEIGLDKRDPCYEQQKDKFLSQCELAKTYQKPVIIHCVGKEYDLYKLIKNNFPGLIYIFHSFSGSIELYNTFSIFNTYVSLNANIIQVKNASLKIQHFISQNRYVFETDAPYQAQPFIENNFNHTYNLVKTVNMIQAVHNFPLENLIKTQYHNIRNIFPDLFS